MPAHVLDPVGSALHHPGALTPSDLLRAAYQAPSEAVGSPLAAEQAARHADAARREATLAGRRAAVCLVLAASVLMTLPDLVAPLFTAPGPTVLTTALATGLVAASLWFRGRRARHLARWRRHLAALVTAA